jgi:hypothetical protein
MRLKEGLESRGGAITSFLPPFSLVVLAPPEAVQWLEEQPETVLVGAVVNQGSVFYPAHAYHMYGTAPCSTVHVCITSVMVGGAARQSWRVVNRAHMLQDVTHQGSTAYRRHRRIEIKSVGPSSACLELQGLCAVKPSIYCL